MKPPQNTKHILALALLSACSSPSIYAQYAGPFGYGIELKGTGAGALHSGITILYALDNGGTTRLTPNASSATLDQTSWANGTTTSPVLSLGTFNPGAGDTLTILGGSMLTYQGAGATVGTGVYLNYAVDPASGPYHSYGPGLLLTLNQSDVAGAIGDLRWSNESESVDLLTGRAPGTYVLQTYGYAGSSVGDLYENNGGGNFGATFTVVTGTGLPTTPTNITYSVSDGILTLSWPANYQGWLLQFQTNAVSVGIQTNASAWHDMPGSASIISTNIPINQGNPSVFYRLRLP